MQFVKQKSRLREDAVIGIVFTAFFALGLLMASIWPTSVSIQTIVLGNILAISTRTWCRSSSSPRSRSRFWR